MNTFEVLMWLCETFGIETVGQLAAVLAALDLLVHFVSSGLAGYFLWRLTLFVTCNLFSLVSRRRGYTTADALCISLFSLSVALFVSAWVHCWQDFGWHGLLSRLSFIF